MNQAASASAALAVFVGSFLVACGGSGGKPKIAFVRSLVFRDGNPRRLCDERRRQPPAEADAEPRGKLDKT
jgi:hypothetical protein